MANKQSVGVVQLEGVAKKQPIKTVMLAHGSARELEDDADLNLMGSAVEIGKALYQQQQKLEEQNRRLDTAAALANYRQQLMTTQSYDDFDKLAGDIQSTLKMQVNLDDKGKAFWQENGDKIIKANQNDIDKIRQLKAVEFGKNSLDEVLVNSQNILAQSPSAHNETVLEKGLEAIKNTPFLDDNDKEIYRQNYLKSGVLNMALNNPETARMLADKYLPEDNEIKDKIKKTEALILQGDEAQKNKSEREDYLGQLQQSLGLWQQKERGEINSAAFYVLKAGLDDKMLWGDEDKDEETPLVKAYYLFKKMNSGEELKNEEIGDVENYLIKAYQKHLLGFEETASLQNKFLALQAGDNSASGTYDSHIDDLSDKVLSADTDDESDEGKMFMEAKAKLCFELYDAYGAKKDALLKEFTDKGGVLSPSVLRRFEREAVAEVRDELGLKESATEVAFNELKEVMDSYYTGHNKKALWQKFLKSAPYQNDKKMLMKNIAAAETKRELKIPKFDSIGELNNAHLAKGEKFYFKGRLAIKS